MTRQLLAFSRKQVIRLEPLDLNDVIGNLAPMLGRLIGEDVTLRTSFAPRLPLVQADVQRIIELYRRNGVNPLGGCLPMVLQFPVFIGLYNALSTPIELRHAPFMWIKDLSRPDWQSLPFTLGGWHLGVPILTLLMGASMFVQQWMTPSAGDPNQRKMMMMMPLMFTFMFVSFPAGLTVYWLVNNVLTIGQQYWINRRAG